ncbi:MAG: phosphotransferase [Gemmatimonadetes bacterium]|nr:phosphotransferase [Gemmatimonadota bacterium]
MAADDALDIERPESLLAYLRESGRIGPQEQPRLQRLAGGVSSRAVLVEREPPAGSWVLKQALPKLRVAVDWFSSPERMRREALALRWMPELVPAGSAPSLVWEDPDAHLLAMTAVPQPHVNWKTALLHGRELAHAEAFGRLLGTVHRRAWERRREIQRDFADRSFFESLRVEPYYRYTADRIPHAAPFLGALIEQTDRVTETLVHGDFSPKNVLVHEGRLVLLDYEVAHFGDPAFDVGFSSAHLLSKANHLRALEDSFARAATESWRAYRAEIDATGFGGAVESRAVRHTLACLLARVDGRSPLEYLDEGARRRQRAAAVALMHAPPTSMPALVTAWQETLREHDVAD